MIQVGTVSTREGLALITRKQPQVDLIELRFDALRANHADALGLARAALEKRQNLVLLTLRTQNEGGAHGWKSTERIRLFEKLLPYADAVDFELANLPLIKSALQLARRLGKKIVLSTHSTKRKITYKRGIEWLEHARHTRAEIYKIATLARTRKDLNVLVKLLVNHPELRLAIMATGPQAKTSRLVLPLLGSRLVYGYLDAPAAKGQPPLREVSKALEL